MSDNSSALSSFLDPGLDFASDTLTDAEAAAYLAWAEKIHNTGNLALTPFARFFVDFDPKGLKQLRRHTSAIDLPAGAAVLMWTYSYCLKGSEKGTLYEVIAARELGASKQEILELFHVAAYFGGPLALNAAAAHTSEYLHAWPDGEGTGIDWPEGWVPDPHAFESGIDMTTLELTPADVEALRAWYVRVYGQVPPALELSARVHPRAFKGARMRFERLLGEALPARLIPLLMLHSATLSGAALAGRRAAQLALSVGATHHDIATTIHWASAYGGETTFEPMFAALSDVLDEGQEGGGHDVG